MLDNASNLEDSTRRLEASDGFHVSSHMTLEKSGRSRSVPGDEDVDAGPQRGAQRGGEPGLQRRLERAGLRDGEPADAQGGLHRRPGRLLACGRGLAGGCRLWRAGGCGWRSVRRRVRWCRRRCLASVCITNDFSTAPPGTPPFVE